MHERARHSLARHGRLACRCQPSYLCLIAAFIRHDSREARTTRRANMSEQSTSYKDVTAREYSRLHAGHVYNNVTNSKPDRTNQITVMVLTDKRLRYHECPLCLVPFA